MSQYPVVDNKNQPGSWDAFDTVTLNQILKDVMLELRKRDAKEIKKNFLTKSQRTTLSQQIRHHTTQ